MQSSKMDNLTARPGTPSVQGAQWRDGQKILTGLGGQCSRSSEEGFQEKTGLEGILKK